MVSRVGQIAEKEGWRCRELVKSLRKKAGGVESLSNRQSEKGWRCRGDRQTAEKERLAMSRRQANRQERQLAVSRRQANRQSEKGWRQNFQVEIPATESWQPVRLPDRDVGGSPPLQGNKNSCDTSTGENDKSDPDHADQNPWGCFRQGSIPHTAGNYDRDDHHADGVTDGAHSC